MAEMIVPPQPEVSEIERHHEECSKVVRSAFDRKGVPIDSEEAWKISRIAVIIPDHLRFQDPYSKKLLEKTRRIAVELGECLEEIWSLDKGDIPDSHLINLCEGFFPTEEDYEHTMGTLLALVSTAEMAVGFGAKGGKGRRPLFIFYAFVRDLQRTYLRSAGKKGFYEKDGTAKGPFVDVVYEAQAILPSELQHRDKRTIGNRVLEAFTEKNNPKISN